MPNCFQLLRDGEPVPLVHVDEEMCRHFNEPCHPKRWHMSWYDTIGACLADGDGFDRIRATYADFPELVRIADWLEASFTVRHWYETRSHPR